MTIAGIKRKNINSPGAYTFYYVRLFSFDAPIPGYCSQVWQTGRVAHTHIYSSDLFMPYLYNAIVI